MPAARLALRSLAALALLTGLGGVGCGPKHFERADFRFTSQTYLKLDESSLDLSASPKVLSERLAVLFKNIGATNLERLATQEEQVTPPDGPRCLEAMQAVHARYLEALTKDDVAMHDKVDVAAEYKSRGVEAGCAPRRAHPREGVDSYKVTAELSPALASFSVEHLLRIDETRATHAGPRLGTEESTRATTGARFTSSIAIYFWRLPGEEVTHAYLKASPMRQGEPACNTCTIDYQGWADGNGDREAKLVRTFVALLKSWDAHTL